MDDLIGSKAAAAITTANYKRPRRTSRNQTHQPQDSMKDVVGSKMEAEAAVITTTIKKRPRRVRPTKSKPKEEEEALKEVDMEDLGFCGNEILEIRAFLLEWYDRNQRDLPWRRICRGDDEDGSDRRAYDVWVSEVMLQQTRVQTVIDYFNRWMHKWPTICHLARASIEEVNEMWAGLGYYRRARYLLEGSKKIVEGGGVFPKTVAALRKVPGIGDYTAGAIASIAFNETVPVVDGNVIRVVARLKAISANPKESVTIKNFWKLAGQLVDPSRPGDFNQALMELGATVCTPLNPNCSVCPVSNHCHALSLAKQNKSAQVTDYPTKVVKSKKRHEFSAVSVVEILDGQDMIEELQPDGRFLLVKRPDEGLLAGLWEFPSVLLGVETDLATRRYAIDQFLKKSFNLDLKKSCTVVLREDIGQYIHVFSHIRLKMYVELLVLRLKGRKNVLHGKPESETKAWKSVDSKALSSMGLTSGVRKVFSMIQKFKQNKSEPIPGKARKRKTPSS
ncbi:Adenine DNA glycosylase [Actinidia chinensis var. chinensis]|uniref:Adenine DNA glycosylase n=1 Tax=Actinidia chinensis var. chinensis TaxID=1590841 RepID=A0A2R6QJJ4_ACTCC|nr:Adenine DNA glycosylase [Actinidia chinensis var. chinensis]